VDDEVDDEPGEERAVGDFERANDHDTTRPDRSSSESGRSRNLPNETQYWPSSCDLGTKLWNLFKPI
jgi:hypothetical protein